MSSQVITFEAPEALIATIDEIAANRDVDRAAILRDALDGYLTEYRELKADLEEADRQIAAGETVPHEEMVAWFRSKQDEVERSGAA